MNRTPFSDILAKAKYRMRYKTDQKPPAGYEPISGSKSGGYRKKFGGKWRYWYPWKYSKRVAQHGEYIGAEKHMHVGSKYEFSLERDGKKVRGHLEVIAMQGDMVKIKGVSKDPNAKPGKEKWLTKQQLTKLLQDHHAADISSHQEFLKRKIAQAVTAGTAKQKQVWFDEARRYGVVFDGNFDVKDYAAGTPPSNISLMRHEDIAPAITRQVPSTVTNFPNPNEEEGYYSLFRHQEEGIARVLQSWEDRDGFVLQDEAGLGKTLTAVGAMVAHGGRRNLVVVPTRGGRGLKGQWQEAADLYNLDFKSPKEGGDGYFIASYNQLYEKVEGPDGEPVIKLRPEYEGKFDTIVFDEAHSMANPRSGESQGGVLVQENADKVLYMSATPYTNIRDTHYLRKMGWFKDGGEFVNWAEKLGANISRRAGEAGAIPFDVQNPRSPLPSVAVAALLHSSGGGAKRVPNYAAITNRQGDTVSLNVSYGEVKAESLTPEWQETLKLGDEVQRLAVEAGLNPLTTGGRMFGWRQTAWEAAKAEKAVDEAKKRLDADPNAQVLLFTNYTKFSDARVRGMAESIRYRVNETGTLPESSLEFADKIDEIADKMQQRDTLNYMTVELGSHLAGRKLSLEEAKQYVGQVHGGANSKEETAEYQKGNKRVIVGTIKKGGTGLSYHDRQGGRKRHQINLSLPLAGAEFQQVSGRSYRMGSQSDVDMVWLHGDDDFEKKVGDIVGRKLASMGALVEGNPAANVSAQDMLNWETAQASDLDEYAESVTAIETGNGDVEQAKDFFRESVQKLRDGTDVLEEVGVRVTGSRERTRDRRARLAVAQLGSIGIGVQKVGSGVKITGMPIGTEAYERVKEMYAPKPGAKKKAFNLAKYNAKDETWTIRDPNDVRKIAIKLDVAKREVSPVSGWDDATLAQAVAANANHHMTYKMSESTAGPFTRLLEQARELTDQAEPTDQLDPHQFVSAQV